MAKRQKYNPLLQFNFQREGGEMELFFDNTISGEGTEENPFGVAIRKIETSDAETNNLTIDLSKDRNRHKITYTGTDDGTISFTGLANKDSSTFIVVENNNKAFRMLIPTANIVSGGVTYAVKDMYSNEHVIPFSVNRSTEIHVVTERVDATHAEIRITAKVQP